MWPQLSPSLICPQLQKRQGGRRVEGKKSVGSALLWGSVGGSAPLRGGFAGSPIHAWQRGTRTVPAWPRLGAGMAPGASLCHSPAQCSEAGASAAILVRAEQRAGRGELPGTVGFKCWECHQSSFSLQPTGAYVKNEISVYLLPCAFSSPPTELKMGEDFFPIFSFGEIAITNRL